MTEIPQPPFPIQRDVKDHKAANTATKFPNWVHQELTKQQNLQCNKKRHMSKQLFYLLLRVQLVPNQICTSNKIQDY